MHVSIHAGMGHAGSHGNPRSPQHNRCVCLSACTALQVFDEPGTASSPLALPGAAERCVELFSFAKSHQMGGFRLGFALGNAQALASLEAVKVNLRLGWPSCLSTHTHTCNTPPFACHVQRRQAHMHPGCTPAGRHESRSCSIAEEGVSAHSERWQRPTPLYRPRPPLPTYRRP